MSTAAPSPNPQPISPCALVWDERASRTRCVNRSAAHRILGHQVSLRPLLDA